MDRISKLLIVGWAVAALLIECYYVSGSWHAVVYIGPLIFVAVAAATAADRRAVAAVAVSTYLFPVIIWVGNGGVPYHVHYSIAWLAAVLAVVVPDALRSGGWSVPVRWRVPLACWAGGVCLTAPIIAFRAVDFRTDLLFRGRLPLEILGGVPLLTVGWILHVALVLAIGVLWFDWICGLEEPFFFRWVVVPMGAGALLLGGVAVYQLFVDVRFLNPTVYAGIRRAAGTMMDANVTGVLAGVWIGGWLAIAQRSGRAAIAPLVALFLWLAVWATGSRTGFASALLVSVISIGVFMQTRASRRRVLLGVVLGAAALGAMLFVVGRSNPRVVGPMGRLLNGFSQARSGGSRAVLLELWNRNGYGVAATRAIQAYPAFGVGVGSFHEMAGEFGGWLPPDNAQNWYRHQLVELGLVGSVGWIVFVASFGWWVIRRRAGERPGAWPPRAAIIAIGAVSLLGVPGQDPAVALTLWTMCGWYLFAAGRPHSAAATAPRWAWIAAFVVVVAFAVGTAVTAAGPLRLPARIQRAGGDFRYGFYWPEPDGEGGEYQWAKKEATAVVPALTRSLELTLTVNRADLAEHPSMVKAWVDGRQVIDTRLTATSSSVTVPVLLPDGERHVLIDTSTDRSVVAPPPDGRELAVMVRWRFRPSCR